MENKKKNILEKIIRQIINETNRIQRMKDSDYPYKQNTDPNIMSDIETEQDNILRKFNKDVDVQKTKGYEKPISGIIKFNIF